MLNAFSVSFLVALIVMCALRLWLGQRQISWVLAHRAVVPAGFADRINLDAHKKAADYTVARTRFGRAALLVEVALLLAFTFGGGLQDLHEFWSARVNGLPYGIALIFSVMLLAAVADLPLAFYHQFVVEAKFGFNRMTIRLFVADLLKQAILVVVIGTPALLAVLWLMEQMGPLWWVYVWLFWCVFNLLIVFLYPNWIAPLFNRFVALDDERLTARVERLLARCGFTSSGLFVMDGSKRSGHGNAYFTGFGKSKRIVFFDTLLARLQAAEVEAVLAHELGHFKHRHVQKRIALLFATALCLLAVVAQLIDSSWFFSGLGVHAQNAALALILVSLAGPVFSFLLTPLLRFLSRRDEFAADRYAAANASASDLIAALVKLYEDNAATLTPDPLHSLFYDSHPPAALRIARLRQA
ncbi:MAG TPA: M48 family metallopeptidase [Accumulibacter sp.]|uniref:M48 family metallopeptidase n=1 Tax=Accumulibacter sp. TaxID=2053492 RepID=UPI0025FB4633|nr:M48 family metallopeptidase [Accumulibacter sp.]MCM8599883.1 M48 family metallopeptidase [Accumulibacter sp.]MCM8664067.1 M48 family metallopeptidase [Accumulibacter sp.]HNC51278.1 M48 family metallopeptidase [Accumulibacter sp.]